MDIVGRVNRCHPAEVYERADNRVGCYAFLYRASPESYYTTYVGYSARLQTEIATRVEEWELDASFPFTAAYISNSAIAREYEEDLIRYYAPPWNKRFFK